MRNLLRDPRAFSAIIAVALLAAGCEKSPTAPTPTPVPVSVSSVTPVPVIRSEIGQVMTIGGLGFRAGLTLRVIDPTGSSVTLAGVAILNLSSTSFQVAVILPSAGRYGVVVQQSDGEASSQFSFDVFDPPPATPKIDSVSPDLTIIDSEPQPVALIGSRFAASFTLRIVDPDGVISERTTPGFSVNGDSLIQLMMVFNKVGAYTFSLRHATGVTSNTIEVRVR
jgi:hypothetical protein